MARQWRWRGVLCVCLLAAGLQAHAAHAELSVDDTRTIVELALQWAVDGGIPDFSLATNKTDLVVANQSLPLNLKPQVPKHTVTILSLLQIQARADITGDFLYFRFGELSEEDQRVRVPIGLFWAVGMNSTKQYVSGGGSVLDFEKRDGKWTLLPVTNRWMS